jgi:hypothetical protein
MCSAGNEHHWFQSLLLNTLTSMLMYASIWLFLNLKGLASKPALYLFIFLGFVLFHMSAHVNVNSYNPIWFVCKFLTVPD